MSNQSQTPPPRSSVIPSLALFAIVAALSGGFFAGYRTAPSGIKAAQQDFEDGYDAAAARLFQPLADAGNANAQFNLAEIYLGGYKVKADPPRAVALLTKSANSGFVPAELLLGEVFLNGNVVLQDFITAKTWLMKAAMASDTVAQRDIAQMYDRGWGVAQDPIESYAWAAAAASRGNKLAESERDTVLSKLPVDLVAKAQARAEAVDSSIKNAKPLAPTK